MNPRVISLSALLHAGAIVALASVAGTALRSPPSAPPTLRFLPAEPVPTAAALARAAEPAEPVVTEPPVEPEPELLAVSPRPFDSPPERDARPRPRPPAPAELVPAEPRQRLRSAEPPPAAAPAAVPEQPAARPPATFVEARALDALNEKPDYPREAVRRGWSGTVRLRLSIDASGAVTEVEVLAPSRHGLLDRAAVRAAWRWRFSPARLDGAAVPSVRELPVEFRLLDG